MNASPTTLTPAPLSTFQGLISLISIVFLGFLSIGIPLQALALQLHSQLHLSTVVVGWVIGIQSLATVISRHPAGVFSDRRGTKKAVLIGLALACFACISYSIATLVGSTSWALAWIILGRLLLAVGESLFVTSAMSWGISRLGAARTGRVMAWQGIAMYGAISLGATIGLFVQQHYGFRAVAGISAVCPLVAAVLAYRLPAPTPSQTARTPFYQVIKLIWKPGLILGLATVPFAALATFLSLYFADRPWHGAGTALLGFGLGYILVRLLWAHLPDKVGGKRVAQFSLVVEIMGQAMLWQSATPTVAILGAMLTGVGFSLIFPAMGVEATRFIQPHQRGQAVGNFTAFFDLALGLTGPLLAGLTTELGYSMVFLAGSVSALTAIAMLATRRGKLIQAQ